jgi:hypothetical protein
MAGLWGPLFFPFLCPEQGPTAPRSALVLPYWGLRPALMGMPPDSADRSPHTHGVSPTVILQLAPNWVTRQCLSLSLSLSAPFLSVLEPNETQSQATNPRGQG